MLATAPISPSIELRLTRMFERNVRSRLQASFQASMYLAIAGDATRGAPAGFYHAGRAGRAGRRQAPSARGEP
jgi:hypothetical protein